ncbi:hypothetical protein IQ268_22075 [Oculatella sp. LEGE 06141]|uniref:hypothetical protein n=1 Tax=Oculatella sp. LEGE 06141 TaxID=1828648 RepID=UPI00187FF4FE|nr:hypothetical protein [Oculatella sp. LEGE 06141]MBE9181253.1 hypothetical protein [Oculatella sp. LEGE 06141]
METAHFLTWFAFIAAIAGGGIAAMVWAYQGSGSVSVLFDQPVTTLSERADIPPALTNQFQAGVATYQAGHYRTASDQFAEVIQQMPTLAEAHHNRGLAIANLRQDREAVANLVAAAELYLQQDNQTAFQQVKQHLEVLKARP